MNRPPTAAWCATLAIAAALAGLARGGEVTVVGPRWPDRPDPTPEQSQVDESQIVGGGQSGYGHTTQQERPRDLTLANFFSAGWDDEWAKQERATGTPNMALLRVQTNFIEREFRANYYLENNVATRRPRT